MPESRPLAWLTRSSWPLTASAWATSKVGGRAAAQEGGEGFQAGLAPFGGQARPCSRALPRAPHENLGAAGDGDGLAVGVGD